MTPNDPTPTPDADVDVDVVEREALRVLFARALNAASIDAQANTPDLVLADRMLDTPAAQEWLRRQPEPRVVETVGYWHHVGRGGYEPHPANPDFERVTRDRPSGKPSAPCRNCGNRDGLEEVVLFETVATLTAQPAPVGEEAPR